MSPHLGELTETVLQKMIQQVLNNERLDLLDLYLASDLEFWHAFGKANNLNEQKQFLSELSTAFSNLNYEIKDFFIDSSRFAFHYTATGLHVAPFQGYEPCHQMLTWHGMTIFHMRHFRAVKGWVYTDMRRILDQHCNHLSQQDLK